MKKLHYLLLSVTTLFNFEAFALVDYSDNDGGSRGNRFDTPYDKVRRTGPRTQGRAAKAGKPLASNINFLLKYDSLDIRSTQKDGKASVMKFEGHIQTQNNIFLDFEYWQAQTDSEEISRDTGYQEGNPEVRLGFNWLKFGEGNEAANIDIYAGGRFKASGSELASTRNDKIFGLQTSKMFAQQFMISFGGEYRILGNPKSEDELKLGNQRSFIAAMVWAATPDIRFAMELTTTKITQGEADEDRAVLDEDISFANVSPKLLLMLHPNYNVELGANFRTRKASSDQDLTRARLLADEGSYGNSIYAGINITL
jgi:hypothetical protein